MAYIYTTAARLRNRVRRMITQSTFGLENVQSETDVLDEPATVISDDFIYQALSSAQQNIVVSCKACNIWRNINRVDGESDLTTINNSTPVRFLFTTVERNGNWSVFRTTKQSVLLERTGQTATGMFPTFEYTNGELTINPDLQTGDTVSYHFVEMPDDITQAADVPEVDMRFEAAMVYYAASLCYERMDIPGLQQIMRDRYEDEIQPYRLNVGLNLADGREVLTE